MSVAVVAMAEPMFSQDAVAVYLKREKVSKENKLVQSSPGDDEAGAGSLVAASLH